MSSRMDDWLNLYPEPVVPNRDEFHCGDCDARIGLVGVGPACRFCGSNNIVLKEVS